MVRWLPSLDFIRVLTDPQVVGHFAALLAWHALSGDRLHPHDVNDFEAPLLKRTLGLSQKAITRSELRGENKLVASPEDVTDVGELGWWQQVIFIQHERRGWCSSLPLALRSAHRTPTVAKSSKLKACITQVRLDWCDKGSLQFTGLGHKVAEIWEAAHTGCYDLILHSVIQLEPSAQLGEDSSCTRCIGSGGCHGVLIDRTELIFELDLQRC